MKVVSPDGNVRSIITGDILQFKAVVEFRKVVSSNAAFCRFCSSKLTEKNRAPNPPSVALENVFQNTLFLFNCLFNGLFNFSIGFVCFFKGLQQRSVFGNAQSILPKDAALWAFLWWYQRRTQVFAVLEPKVYHMRF